MLTCCEVIFFDWCEANESAISRYYEGVGMGGETDTGEDYFYARDCYLEADYFSRAADITSAILTFLEAGGLFGENGKTGCSAEKLVDTFGDCDALGELECNFEILLCEIKHSIKENYTNIENVEKNYVKFIELYGGLQNLINTAGQGFFNLDDISKYYEEVKEINNQTQLNNQEAQRKLEEATKE